MGNVPNQLLLSVIAAGSIARLGPMFSTVSTNTVEGTHWNSANMPANQIWQSTPAGDDARKGLGEEAVASERDDRCCKRLGQAQKDLRGVMAMKRPGSLEV